jgi:hypothetical protein
MIGETCNTDPLLILIKWKLFCRPFLSMLLETALWQGSIMNRRAKSQNNRDGTFRLRLPWVFPMQFHPFITPGGTVLLHSRGCGYLGRHCRGLQKSDRIAGFHIRETICRSDEDRYLDGFLADGGFMRKRLRRERIKDQRR